LSSIFWGRCVEDASGDVFGHFVREDALQGFKDRHGRSLGAYIIRGRKAYYYYDYLSDKRAVEIDL
jgi:hypothetical protein